LATKVSKYDFVRAVGFTKGLHAVPMWGHIGGSTTISVRVGGANPFTANGVYTFIIMPIWRGQSGSAVVSKFGVIGSVSLLDRRNPHHCLTTNLNEIKKLWELVYREIELPSRKRNTSIRIR